MRIGDPHDHRGCDVAGRQALGRNGFRAAHKSYSPEGTYIDETVRWGAACRDMMSVEHILPVNSWKLAYRLVLGALTPLAGRP